MDRLGTPKYWAWFQALGLEGVLERTRPAMKQCGSSAEAVRKQCGWAANSDPLCGVKEMNGL